jgi:integrase
MPGERFTSSTVAPMSPGGPVRSREWNRTVTRAIEQGVDVPEIRLHDLRHTHATVLLRAGEPVHIVSQRLGRASVVVTPAVYTHVMPDDQKRAASRFAELVA